LPGDAPEGLCPRCLLQAVISSAHDAGSVSPDATDAYQGPAPAPTVAELAPLLPQLEIIELLGQGGMGAVYKARQPSLDRLVAVKVLPRQASQDPAFAERFTREARALARLSHPNIVAVHDVGKAGDFYYFVMEYVEGVNLRQLLRAGQLPPQQALQIVPQICDALQYAHEEGVVHRDIKPENILLDRRGRVKIADFGLAKLLGRDTGNFTLTGSRQVMGTLYYMAPEQMERPLEVDHRADIYSLGVVFYEMLTGQLPIGRFPLPSEKVGSDGFLDRVVLHALEREPAQRYQHASEVKTDVQSVADGPVPAARTATRDAGDEDLRRDLAVHQLSGPANLLLVAAVAGILFCATAVAMIVIGEGGDLQTAMRFRLPEMVVALLASLVGGGLVIVGAQKMKRLQAYEFSVIVSFLALLPITTFGWPLGIIAGLWALWILGKPEVRAAFTEALKRSLAARARTAQQQDATAADHGAAEFGRQTRAEAGPASGGRARVRRPALALLLVGVLHIAILPASWLPGLLPFSGSRATPVPPRGAVHGPLAAVGQPVVATSVLATDVAEPPMWYRRGLLPFLLLSVSLGTLIIIGAVQMLRLRSHAWAMAAALLALLPCGLAWPVGLPVGIWALVVLAAPEVKAAFAQHRT
jgi:predicted Ser/Thr protein kinase